jgi:predicted ATPase
MMTAAGRAPFVGRGRELDDLLNRLMAAAGGDGGLVLVAGEPGIGKTRLLAELAHAASSRGWAVLNGRAYETEGMPPYLPFVEALRGYLRASPPEALRGQLGQGAAEVALLVPELRDHLPDLPDEPSLSPEMERYRLFEGVTDVLCAIARSQESGLVLVLDDLHWADKPALLLLQHLIHRLAGVPLLVAGAYRTVDLDRTHPLAAMLAELRRENRYERLLLPALTAEDTATLIAEITDVTPAPAVVDAVQRETEGNPFFVSEVVRHLHAEGRDLAGPDSVPSRWDIPEGVRQVIGSRLSRLSPDTNRLLHAASVLRDGACFDVLATVSDIAPESLLDALDEALGAGMLREIDGGYHFTHALIRQTLTAELNLPRRQRLHLRAAEGIERVHARNLDGHIVVLAAHYRLAGVLAEPERALACTRRAAEAATAVYAWEEAVAHYQAALNHPPRFRIGNGLACSDSPW